MSVKRKFKVHDKVKIKRTITNFYQGQTLEKGTEGVVLEVSENAGYRDPYTVKFKGFPSCFFAESELK